ncbi:MAG: 5-(carboxyamino)imidazole ribonucleotide mutase [bacterium]
MPRVAIMMGSSSDTPTMEKARKVLDEFGIESDWQVLSAHRTPEKMAEYVRSAPDRGIRVFICGAGLSAALPGSVAAHTDLPVIGVPLDAALDGLDSLLSIAQMPPGVPVACVGIDNARNAAYLAVSMLALVDEEVAGRWAEFRAEQRG